MNRLFVLVEGQTEESFVKEVLGPHLLQHGFVDVAPRLLGNARAKARRGGITKWPKARQDILKRLKEDPSVCVTTFIDYYALPEKKGDGWPGRAESSALVSADAAAKANHVEAAISADISKKMKGNLHPHRFVPFVMMHEFEALLFSDCNGFAKGTCQPELGSAFQAIRDAFSTPEDINDHKETAPSKRVEGLIPGYQKPLLGNLAALEIGLEVMVSQCPHFAGWVAKLEAIGSTG